MARIGAVIKDKMDQKKITRNDLQSITGYDFRRVNNALESNPNTTLETYINICRVLDMKMKVNNINLNF